MRKELINKLREQRLLSTDSLSRAERQAMERDPTLLAELQMNKALIIMQPDTPEAPDVKKQIDMALANTNKYRETRSAKAAIHGSFLTSLRPQRTAVMFAVVLVITAVLTGIFVSWFSRNSFAPPGVDIGPQVAWASTDGYYLDFDVEFDEYYSGTTRDSAEHPLWQLQLLVDDWNKAQAPLLGERPDNWAELELPYAKYMPISGKNYRYTVRIKVYRAVESALNELIDNIKAATNLSEIKVMNQLWYYSEKYPNTHVAGRTIFINGQEYTYPVDVDMNCFPFLHHLLINQNERGHFYYALADIEEFKRYGLGSVIRVRCDEAGNVLVETYPADLDFEALGLPSWFQYFTAYVSPTEIEVAFDPIQMIKGYAANMVTGLERGHPNDGASVIVDLLPIREWLGVDTASLQNSISEKTRLELESAVEELDAVLSHLFDQYPDAKDHIVPFVQRINGIPIQWQADIQTIQSEPLQQQLKSAIQNSVNVPARIIPSMPRPLAKENLPSWMQGERKGVLGTMLVWGVLPQVRWLPLSGEDQYAALKQEFSAEEIATAQMQARLIEDAYQTWMQDHPELEEKIFGEPLPPERSTRSYLSMMQAEDIILNVAISIWSEDKEEANALAKELCDFIMETTDIQLKPHINSLNSHYYISE